MAKQTNPKEDLARYRRRITESKAWRSEEQYDDLWRRMIDLYTGKQFNSPSPEDRVAVNIAFATMNVIYPSIAMNYPKVSLTARDPEDNDKAIIAEAVIDYTWRSAEIGAADEFRLAVKDYLMLGHGWVKTGWKVSYREVQKSEDQWNAEFEDAKAQANEAAVANPETAKELPTDDDIAASIGWSDQVVDQDRVFVERVSPFDMFVDPEATNMKNAKWVAQRITRPLDDVRKDKRYNAKARESVAGETTVRWSPEANKRRRPSDIDRVVVWEFYDLTCGTLSVFAESGEGFLIDPVEIPLGIGQPFVMLRNYDVPDEFYPMGDLEAIEPLQHELNRTRTQLINARQHYARKYLVDDAVLTPAARSALESNRDGEVIPINTNGGQVRMSEVIAPAPMHQLPADLFQYGSQVEDDIDTVSGVSEYQRGGASQIRRTATEASMIQDAVQARSAEKLATIERAVAAIGKNMLELMRQFLTGDQVISIVGNMGRPIWVPYTQEDIDVDADFTVEGGSTQPKNESYRQNMAMQMLQALGPMVGQVVDPAELAKFVLQSFGVKQPEKFIMAQPPAPPGMPPGGPQGPPQGPGGPPEGSEPGMPPEGMEPGMPPEMMEGAPPAGGPPDMSALPAIPPGVDPQQLLELLQANPQNIPPGMTPEMLVQMMMQSQGQPPAM